MEGKKYDFTIFGASGFTGKFVVDEVAEIAEENGLKWAVAGRSLEKLDQVLNLSSAKTGKDLKSIAKIEVDCSNQEALVSMCKDSKVIINCVGPFILYGEPVVKACIEGKSHHVDISGETPYLETMQLKYFDEAKKAGIFIVGACGFDSIPVEMGVIVGKKKMQGDVNSIEAYIKTDLGSAGRLNAGTYESVLQFFTHYRELAALKAQNEEKYDEKHPITTDYPLNSRGLLFYSNISRSYCIPFVGPDTTLVTRSNLLSFKHYNEKPAQIAIYMGLKLWMALSVMAAMPGLFLMTRFNFTRSLLINNPAFFTFGYFKKGGPNDKERVDVSFEVTVVLNGWKDKLTDTAEKHTEKPNKKVTVTVGGIDPGYTITAKFLVQSALAILKESDKIHGEGGVYPPGFAFRNTSLLDKLEKRGIKFTVVEE